MSQRPLTFIIPILPALSSVSGGQNVRPKASLCEGGVMAFGHDGGRDVIRTFSPPVGFADSPLSEGAKKAVARRAKKSSFRGAQIPCKCPCGACENRLISPPRPAEFTLYHSNLLQQLIISRKICRHARFFAFQTLPANRLKSCEILQN